jgi:alginate O-acetyltransferase complex protein AlgI
MNIELYYFIFLFFLVSFIFLFPKKYQIDVICITTIFFILFLSPLSCMFLLLLSVGSYFCVKYSNKNKILFLLIFFLFLALLIYKLQFTLLSLVFKNYNPLILMGISYYVCRHIHVLFDIYNKKIISISLREYLHYHFFLPVLIAGPINRYQHFQRQSQRRRWESKNLTNGFERVLYGYAKVIIIGNYLINLKFSGFIEKHLTSDFISTFIFSSKDWLYLYFQFSGYTDIALGFSLALGFTIEENFNYPLKAQNLIDFWHRWHITLSKWCRDYVFFPVQAFTRNQFMALVLAMIIMGLWHEASLYYILWGGYQALGIAIVRAYEKNKRYFKTYFFTPKILNRILSIILTFFWLVSGRPIILYLISML